MTPGLWYGPNKGKKMTVGDAPEQYRMKGAANDALVQLECASCHQMDGATPKTVRGDGRIMAPISFERDCKAMPHGGPEGRTWSPMSRKVPHPG